MGSKKQRIKGCYQKSYPKILNFNRLKQGIVN
jgi:hypothetical protein